MRFEPDTRSLVFASQAELESFHRELTELLRQAMMDATRQVEDPTQATRVSQQLMRENRVAMSALNQLRRHLPKKQF